MAISFDVSDPNDIVISVPQSDLSLISGTLYEHDTEAFRLELIDWEDSEEGMHFPRTHTHSTKVTIAGVEYSRFIELQAPYSVEYENGSYSVRLSGSNNNLFDVENGILVQNNVQIIANNAAGLQTVTSGSGVLPSDVTDIKNAIFDEIMETGFDFRDFQLIMAAAMAGKASGMETTSGIFRSVADAKNRISVTMDENGNRTAITFDLT
jgi:hypothetical protein